MLQWLLPPPNPPLSSSRGPSAPALSHYVGEMFGGLSVPACRTVSKHNVSQWAPSQFVSVCVSVSVWMISSPTNSLPLLFYSNSFHIVKKKQGRERGGDYRPEAVHTNNSPQMSLGFQMTGVSKIPTFAYVSFKFLPIAEGKI